MAIVAVRKLNKAQADLVFEQGDKPTIKTTRTDYYQVKSDSLTEASYTVEAVVPPLGSSYGFDFNTICTGIKSERDEKLPYHWTVEVKYDTLNQGQGKQPPPNDPNNPTDPRNWTPEIQTGWVKRQAPLYVDVNGNPLVNSCGQPIDPPPFVDDDVLQIRISRHESTLGLANMLKFKNVINTKAFWGQPPGCLKLLPITAALEVIPLNSVNYTYFKHTYTIEATSGLQLPFWFDDWGTRPLDRGGCQCIDKSTGKPATSSTAQADILWAMIRDMHGAPLSKTSFLDGHGQPLPANQTPVWVAFAAAQPPPNGNRMDRNSGNLVDGYQGYRDADFSTLKDADGRPLPNLQVFENRSKVARQKLANQTSP